MPTGTPISPRLVKGGIVTMDVDTSVVPSVIALQYQRFALAQSADSVSARSRVS